MKRSGAPYILLLVVFVMLFVIAVAVHSNNEANRISQLRVNTNLSLRQYCTDHKLVSTDCRVWADAQTSSLSTMGVEWASSCTNGGLTDQQVLFCLNYANDLK
jgi:hypothetical protein